MAITKYYMSFVTIKSRNIYNKMIIVFQGKCETLEIT